MKKFLILSLIIISNVAFGQKGERLDKKMQTICYASSTSMGTRIFKRDLNPYSKGLKAWTNASANAEQAADIQVTYNGFSEEAQLAFQAAVDIWAGIISSPVTIYIDATWSQLDEGTLGSASWNTAFRNFEGAKELDTWYPVALAEKMAGRDMNDPESPDIVANFNKGANWYLGSDGNPTDGQYDLISVVLHEIGHGLGFIDSFGYDEDQSVGSFGIQDFPFVFDLSVETSAGSNLAEMDNPSAALGSALISNSVYFDAPSAVSRPRLYAPTTWSAGSSIAHLNEATYPAGNANSLMTPQIGANEVMHDPGPLTLAMFGDMGWEYTYIEPDYVDNSEDISVDSYTVGATINSDVGYQEGEVYVYYSIDNFVSDTTVVQMTTTGNTNEFTAEIVSQKTEGQIYSYFFKVTDINDRVFTKPSLPISARFFQFQTGQDNTPPVILHTKPNFIRLTDQTLNLEAKVTDFLPVSVQLEYYVNDDPTAKTSAFTLKSREDSLYATQVELTSLMLEEGDSIRYKIIAVDASSNENTTVFPESGLIKLNVVSTREPASLYESDFDDVSAASDDFFISDNFTIKEETNFSTGAIHSDHPYSDGPSDDTPADYTFELKIPIILNSSDATISFDEVVLVEPGEDGTSFGDDQFWDYVIVEGSKDGGTTWMPFEDGYDSKDDTDWLSTYNSSIVDNNSEGVGSESLYESRTIDMLSSGNFLAGEEVLIRFRLHADAAAHGWGWAIDNLSIQVDKTAPSILHDHIDFVTTTSPLELNFIVIDNVEVSEVNLVSMVNDQEQSPLSLTQTGDRTYRALVDISLLNYGDVIRYRLEASDPDGNTAYLPSSEEYLEIEIVDFAEVQESYSNDFNTTTDDFVGNIFSVTTPSGFSDGLIYNAYPQAFGLDSTSSFTYTLKTPIVVSASLPYMSYDEVAIIEPFTDFVAVEASKDGGVNWIQLTRYSSSSQPVNWQQRFNSGSPGSSTLFKNRVIDLTSNSSIQAGDEIIIRFRMERESTRTGWGWAIDNLEIQTDQVTALDPEAIVSQVQVYPNPTTNGELKLKVNNPSIRNVDFAIQGLNGQVMSGLQHKTLDAENTLSIDVSALPSGLYLLKVVEGDRTSVHKIMKLD